MSVCSEYFKIHEKYELIYGKNKSVVVIQIGGFYEIYATNDLGPNLKEISKIIGLTVTKKDKKRCPDVSISSPYMMGFPLNSLIKFSEMLMDNNYVVIVVDQIYNSRKDSKEKEERKVTNIYSKGIYIENINKRDGNYIVCIYLSLDPQKDHDGLFSVGLTSCDVSTGKLYIHEACSSVYDCNFALDETDRFISSLNPSEILIYYIDNTKNKTNDKKNKDYIFNYLKLSENDCRFFNTFDNKYTKSLFQNELLNRIYPISKSSISPIEKLNLEKNIYCLTSITLLFDFIYDKNPVLLSKIDKPVFYINTKHLVLGNNAISQLDILPNSDILNKCKFKSLFNVVNNTSTAIGERFLKIRLLSPLISPDELNIIYELTDKMIKNKFYEHVENYLDTIHDIERLERKIKLKILRPFELINFYESYKQILDLIIELQDKNINIYIPDRKIVKLCKSFVSEFEEIFNIDELKKYSLTEFETNIFRPNIYPDIDICAKHVDLSNTFIEDTRVVLNKLMSDEIKKPQKNNKKNNKKDDDDIQYIATETAKVKKSKDTFSYFTLTELKCETLEKVLLNNPKIYVGDIKIKTNKFTFDKKCKKIKVMFPFDKYIDDFDTLKSNLQQLNKKYYSLYLDNIVSKYSELFTSINLFIANIDFVKSCAKTASKYNYVKPIISDASNSFVKVSKMRHPIIERIIDYEYIPHDIELGNELKGLLIFGQNGVGKSSLMKSLGLLIIMAQSGLFVPANSFEFSPYHSLFTRITGNDNIFRGLSSYALEMVELNAILKRANEKTLIIGDEICRGTEHISGNSIVASAIIYFSKISSSFIFATHLHEIMQLKEINELKTVKAVHLHVEYDEKTKSLIYDREMRDGSGENIYGITFARYIIQNDEFIDKALEIKNILTDSHTSLISGKKSKYNSDLLIYECNICGSKDKTTVSNLETHHINFQKDCENGFVKNKKHIKKNQKSNLIVLCNECHDKIHAGKMILDKYVLTSSGKSIVIKNL